MTYELDTTGKSLRNRVVSETKSIKPPTDSSYLFVVAINGPYFAPSLFVKLTLTDGSERILLADIDFYHVFPYMEASIKINAPVFAGIQLIDRTITGTLTYSYQTLGGFYLTGADAAYRIESTFKNDPRFTNWETVADVPTLPDITHPWLVSNIDDVANTVSELEKVGLVVHLRPNFLKEPGTEVFIPTPHEIGLGNVPNYPAATTQQAIEGTETRALMTPATTKAAVNAELVQILSDIGYLVPSPYAGSIHIVNPKFTIEYEDCIYAIKPSAVPYTTTGVWESDKDFFIIVRSSIIENWVRTLITVTGNEPYVNSLGAVFDINVEHDGAIPPQLVLNDIHFLVHGVDYKMSHDKLYVSFPLAPQDVMVLHTKRTAVNLAREKQINKVFVVSDSNNRFDLGDPNINASNLRVSINEFIILNNLIGDYSIVNGILTVNYSIGIGDIIEVENIDSAPIFGKTILRGLMFDEIRLPN